MTNLSYILATKWNTHYDLGVFINKTYYFHSKLLEILYSSRGFNGASLMQHQVFPDFLRMPIDIGDRCSRSLFKFQQNLGNINKIKANVRNFKTEI